MSESLQMFEVDVIGLEKISVPSGTKFQDIAIRFADRFSSPIMLVKCDYVLQELRKEITGNCSVELIDMTNVDGMRVYQRSVGFVLFYVIKEIFGKEADIFIEYSIKKNLYCQLSNINTEITEEVVAKIENKMHEVVNQDLPFEKFTMPLDKGIEIVSEMGLSDRAAALKYRGVSSVNLYKLDWMYDYFYGYMATSTGCLKWFKLLKHEDNIVLQFPSPKAPSTISEFQPVQKISNVFKEYSAWGRILKARTLADLNQIICDNQIGDFIRISEALHEKRISQIADMIKSRGENTKLILVAGPSSSGKTTFAQRLCVQLRVNGITPYVLSLDNYFRNRDEVPLDEFGKPNFETIDYVDIELFNDHLIKLLNNETVSIPTYNFLTGKREYNGNFLKLGHNEVLVAEGIHGLNEKLTPAVSRENKFKIYISALTTLNLDKHNRISTSDIRLIRRITRDSLFRGAATTRTLGMWQSVAKGEAEYIYPFQEESDAIFNSALVYEMSVLKQYVEPLLFSVPKEHPQYTEAKRLIKFIDSFMGVPSRDVPQNSILREFIGGSCFHT